LKSSKPLRKIKESIKSVDKIGVLQLKLFQQVHNESIRHQSKVMEN
jgi:hypothetical protein